MALLPGAKNIISVETACMAQRELWLQINLGSGRGAFVETELRTFFRSAAAHQTKL